MSPSSSATYQAPATVQLRVSASDPDGTIAKVEYYVDGSLLGTTTTSPFDANWTNVPAGTYTVTAKAYDNLNASTTSAGRTITVFAANPANAAPTVTLTRPVNNATYYSPATVPLRASASDSNGTINRVEYYVNGSWLTTVTTAPYAADWSGVSPGTYGVTAVAWDNLGKSTTSSAVSVVVNAPDGANPVPSVSLLQPVSNATYEVPAAITASANAADNNAINRVEFYVNGAYQAAVSTPPYAITFLVMAAGTYTWTAIAYDNQGASTTSAAVTTQMFAANPANPAPTVSVTQPQSNAVFAAPATIPLVANAADPGGSINRVEFFANGTLLGTATAPPFSANWVAVPVGSYSITARAWDNQGKATFSAAVSISVVTDVAPTVSMTSPANNAVFGAPANITSAPPPATPTARSPRSSSTTGRR